MKMGYHESGDWCHVCGKRHYEAVDIFYPDNAEHEKKDKKYVRICSLCVQRAMSILSQESSDERRTLFAEELHAAEYHLKNAISIATGTIPARKMDKLLKVHSNLRYQTILLTEN